MKKKDLDLLKTRTVEELKTDAVKLWSEILTLKMDMPFGKVKNMNEARTKMKNRARILTLIGQKEAAK